MMEHDEVKYTQYRYLDGLFRDFGLEMMHLTLYWTSTKKSRTLARSTAGQGCQWAFCVFTIPMDMRIKPSLGHGMSRFWSGGELGGRGEHVLRFGDALGRSPQGL